MQLAEVYVTIGAKLEKFRAGIKNVEGEFNKFATHIEKKTEAFAKKYGESLTRLRAPGLALTAMGAAMTGSMILITKQAMIMGDAIDKASKRTGLAAETLSKLSYAAQISGSDLNSVEVSLRYLARAMDDTARGTGEAREKFEKLGIIVTNADGSLRNVVDVMKEAASKIAAMNSETEQVAATTDLFGARVGTGLLPMLKEGGAGIDALMNRAEELGLVIDQKSAAAAAEFRDRLTELTESLKFVGIQIGNQLLPLLLPLVKHFTEIAGKIILWVKEHQTLTKTIAGFTLALGILVGAGGTLMIFLSTLPKLALGVGVLSKAIAGLGAAFTWLAMHPAVLIATAISAITIALGLYIKKLIESRRVSEAELKKIMDAHLEMSKKELEITRERLKADLIASDKRLISLQNEQKIYEALLDTVGEFFGASAKWRQKVLELGEQIRETRGHSLDLRKALSELGKAPIKTIEDATDDIEDFNSKLQDTLGLLQAMSGLRMAQIMAMPEGYEREQKAIEETYRAKKAALEAELADSETTKERQKAILIELQTAAIEYETALKGLRQTRIDEIDEANKKALAIVGDFNARSEALYQKDTDNSIAASERGKEEIQKNELDFWNRYYGKLDEAWQKYYDWSDKIIKRNKQMQKEIKQIWADIKDHVPYIYGFPTKSEAGIKRVNQQTGATLEGIENVRTGLDDVADKTEAWGRIWSDVMREIKYAIADAFEDILSGRALDSWKDFAEAIKRIFIKAISDILASYVVKQFEKWLDNTSTKTANLGGQTGQPSTTNIPVSTGETAGTLGKVVEWIAIAITVYQAVKALYSIGKEIYNWFAGNDDLAQIRRNTDEMANAMRGLREEARTRQPERPVLQPGVIYSERELKAMAEPPRGGGGVYYPGTPGGARGEYRRKMGRDRRTDTRPTVTPSATPDYSGSTMTYNEWGIPVPALPTLRGPAPAFVGMSPGKVGTASNVNQTFNITVPLHLPNIDLDTIDEASIDRFMRGRLMPAFRKLGKDGYAVWGVVGI